VSRRSTGPLRKILPAVAVGVVALAGCSVGQVTQTDSIEPAVNGNRADVGDIALRDVMVAYPENGGYEAGDDAPLLLTIVNVGGADDTLVSVSSPAATSVELVGDPAVPGRAALQVVVPDESAQPTSSQPSSQPSTQPETTESSLPESSITEPSAPADTGTPSSPESSSSSSEAPAAESSEPQTTETELAPQEVGTMSIVLTGLTADLPMGKNVPVTFVFASGGQVTVQLPIAAPATARPDPTGEEESGGH